MGIKEGLGGIRQTGRTLYGQSPGAPRFGARARLFQGLGRHHQRMSIGARISHDSQRLFACQTAAVTAHEEVRANRAHVDSPLRGFRTIKRCFSVSDTPDLMQRQRTPREHIRNPGVHHTIVRTRLDCTENVVAKAAHRLPWLRRWPDNPVPQHLDYFGSTRIIAV